MGRAERHLCHHQKMKSLNDRILNALPLLHPVSVREVAHQVGVFTELWEVRDALDTLVALGLADKEMRMLTARERKEKGLKGKEHFRWVYRKV
jgi:hypothetical protein